MAPRDIYALGFRFFGGNFDGVAFMDYPKSVKETADRIIAGKGLVDKMEADYALMIMLDSKGTKEVIQFHRAGKVPDFILE